MSNRLNIQQQAPEAFKAMLNLETAVAESQIPDDLRALIKLRASMINNCRYCLKCTCHGHRNWASVKPKSAPLSPDHLLSV
ncbi:carboxymuconolactone decarboxylase family protein [Aliamphritea spongicola]|nr:carboxymuconolactone decarboxylase family protein [Aliamphritea spongicola]